MSETHKIRQYSLETIKSIAIKTCKEMIGSGYFPTDTAVMISKEMQTLVNQGITTDNKNYVRDVLLQAASNFGIITREARQDMEDLIDHEYFPLLAATPTCKEYKEEVYPCPVCGVVGDCGCTVDQLMAAIPEDYAEMPERDTRKIISLYYASNISPASSGFGIYDQLYHSWKQVADREVWASGHELKQEIAGKLSQEIDDFELYELGVDELPEGLEDIRGKINYQKGKVFGYLEYDRVEEVFISKYFAIVEEEISISKFCPTLKDLCDKLNQGWSNVFYMDDLPTYGGPIPENTHAIFSWDEASYLIQTDSQYKVVTRF